MNHWTLLRILTEWPPKRLRELARNGKRGRGCKKLTQREMAELSGLSVKQIQRIERVNNWLRYDRKTMQKILRYWAACGAEMFHMHRHREFLKRRKK